MGLKITACMHSWDNFSTRDSRNQTQLPLLKRLEQKQDTAHVHTPPRGEQNAKPLPARLLDTHLPHIRNKLTPTRS